MPELERLSLQSNELTGAGLDALQHPNLKLLNLHGNGIADEGARALASALAAGQLPKLEVAELQQNAIGDAGAEALAAALRGGGSASLPGELWMGGNVLGDAAEQALCEACEARGVEFESE